MAGGSPNTTYNLFAGQSLDRLAALSDGLFAIAMTLLALNLHVPVSGAIHGEGDLWHALGKLSPSLVTYFMTFLTLGIIFLLGAVLLASWRYAVRAKLVKDEVNADVRGAVAQALYAGGAVLCIFNTYVS
ncbi:MAG: TMEM175 family protein, partial [Chloroflexota bacterium]